MTRAASKRPVNMTLNEDLIRRARAVTPNLSETRRRNLLAAFVDDEEARAADHQKQIGGPHSGKRCLCREAWLTRR